MERSEIELVSLSDQGKLLRSGRRLYVEFGSRCWIDLQSSISLELDLFPMAFDSKRSSHTDQVSINEQGVVEGPKRVDLSNNVQAR